MKFVFRVDASVLMGYGHVMRCVTLAAALVGTGHRCAFICRELNGNLCDFVASLGYPIARLPVSENASTTTDGEVPHSKWLGADWKTDAEETSRLLSGADAAFSRPDWLIVDQYAIDCKWENALRPATTNIMAIDDIADRRHDCDLLLDQNLVADMDVRYGGRVPEKCALLIGPEYSLLQDHYARLRERAPPRQGAIRNVLIFFGGADKSRLAGRAVRACVRLQRKDIRFDVVIGSADPQLAEVRKSMEGQANVFLHSDVPTLAPLMLAADIAFGAGGATNWERLCLGLPSFIITLASNQVAIAQCLNKAGLIRWLGHEDSVDEGTVFEALKAVVSSGLDGEWSAACKAAVDGRGTRRVCTALTLNAQTPLCIRHAELSDEGLLLRWANDPATRQNAFSGERILPETHRQWFHSRLRAPTTCRIYIAETTDGVAIGQVRFEKGADAWRIDYSVASPFRGRGCGRALLEAALSALRQDEPHAKVSGRVKQSNSPSCSVFNALGFAANALDAETIEYRRNV